MVEVVFTLDSEAENMFCGAPSGSEPSQFTRNNHFSLGFKPFQDDFSMTDGADSSVVLAELYVAFLGNVIISD